MGRRQPPEHIGYWLLWSLAAKARHQGPGWLLLRGWTWSLFYRLHRTGLAWIYGIWACVNFFRDIYLASPTDVDMVHPRGTFHLYGVDMVQVLSLFCIAFMVDAFLDG
ncbi:hypothetical protein BDW74DRAFT_96964 [Aspergillus multicolor]|uniref:uncharacterized protein n=1 Tax=Aspergillus multicolor TaxID=41759 RepID=UPI003CCDD9C2